MERLLQDIIDILPVGVWVSDAQGRLVRSNPAARRIWSGAAPPADEDSGRFEAWWRLACSQLASREAADAPAHDGASVARTIEILCFDGSTKTLLHSTAALHDETGRFSGAVDIGEDITLLKESESRWRRREALLHTMIDLLPVGVWAIDRQGRVTLVNPAADRIWSGHDWKGEIDPHSFKGWWADSSRPVAVDDWAVMRALRQGITSRSDLTHIETLDGSRRTIISWAAPLRDENSDISGAVAVVEDITTLYHAQEQLRLAVCDREQILAIVAHDLRNPLASFMLGAASAGEMAARLPGGEKLGERLGIMLDLARQMSGMVEDLLSIAVSTGGGKAVLSLEPAAPGALLEQACERARPLYDESGIELRCDIESGLPPICADVQRIQRVLANLLDNALKYTEPPCTVLATVQGGETVVFSVANGGPPLSPRQRDAMFQPFWQADRRHSGAGLGLSICRSIVEVHGGSIWTEPAPGQRVRVCFSLPRVEVASAA